MNSETHQTAGPPRADPLARREAGPREAGPREAGPREACPREAGCDIQLQNPCRYPEAGARRLRPWLEPLIAELAPAAGSLAVRFVSDREMCRLNAGYRDRDAVTDVLSFPGDLDPAAPTLPVAAGGSHLGDIVVSVPTARRQARRLGHPAATELRILLLHGVLHCLGHDHEADGGVMERLERRLRSRYIDHE